MARIPIALQLYSVRDDCAQNLQAVLEAVAKMGYEGVEFAGFHGHEAADVRAMLDSSGLKVAGAHVALQTLMGDELERSIEFHQAIGNPYLIVPGLPEERRNSRAAWQQTAEIVDRIAEQLRPHGMQTGYHNHWVEFTPMDGELPLDTFFGNTGFDVIMQFDTGNALHGGADAPPFLQRYPGRAITVHLKEYAAGYDKALIGEGEVPWQTVFGLCETIGGTKWYIVEQESYASPPLECVEKCLQNLRRMGK